MIDKDLQSASFQSVPYFDQSQFTLHMQWKHVLMFHQHCDKNQILLFTCSGNMFRCFTSIVIKIKYYILHVVETCFDVSHFDKNQILLFTCSGN